MIAYLAQHLPPVVFGALGCVLMLLALTVLIRWALMFGEWLDQLEQTRRTREYRSRALHEVVTYRDTLYP